MYLYFSSFSCMLNKEISNFGLLVVITGVVMASKLVFIIFLVVQGVLPPPPFFNKISLGFSSKTTPKWS